MVIVLCLKNLTRDKTSRKVGEYKDRVQVANTFTIIASAQTSINYIKKLQVNSCRPTQKKLQQTQQAGNARIKEILIEEQLYL